MRLESTIEEIHGAGAEVIALSVNEDERQAGMAERWKLSNIQMVSDPGGESLLRPLGLYNPDERDGIAVPAMIVIGPDGDEVYRYEGRDFADRTTDSEVMEAVKGLDLAPIELDGWTPSVSAPDDLKGFFPVDRFVGYFAGNRFAAIAIGGRLPDKESASIARDHRIMAETSMEAWEKLNQ